VLELRDLVKHYHVGDGEPVRAVDGVSLSIARGELVALYGPSGSGKTTLLMMIAALLRPDSGAVLVDGREVSALSVDESASYRLHELGFIDQSVELLAGAHVVENASMKLWLTDIRNAERKVLPLLERLGLGERLRHRPDQLSMGERQRVMIARALSTDPKLVLADEPTGSLDTRRGREVLQLLVELARERGVAILLVTHDPRAASFADRVHALHDGRLVEYEPEESVLPQRDPSSTAGADVAVLDGPLSGLHAAMGSGGSGGAGGRGPG
jgi:putative ABC transport system ATP-binding protein